MQDGVLLPALFLVAAAAAIRLLPALHSPYSWSNAW